VLFLLVFEIHVNMGVLAALVFPWVEFMGEKNNTSQIPFEK
jgi:hypothetical protein